MDRNNALPRSAVLAVLLIAAGGCAADAGQGSDNMIEQSAAGLGELCANGVFGTPSVLCADGLVCVYPDDTTEPPGPDGSSSAATGTCQEPDQTCAPDEYKSRTEHLTAWLVSCTTAEHGQFYERLQEMEHPTEDCAYRYQLMGEQFETKELALSAYGCNGDCLYFPTYSEWIDRCGLREDVQVFQVVPEEWFPLDPIPPVAGCPDLFQSPLNRAYHESMEELIATPCPEPND